MPLDQGLKPRQANAPYIALFDYNLAGWQEGMLTQFPPLSYVYQNPFFYRTDKQGRLELLGRLSLDAIPPEQRANRFMQVTGIAEDMKIIALQGSDDTEDIPSAWKSYKRLPWN